MKFAITILILILITGNSNSSTFPCEKEFFKNLTVFACTYQKRGNNYYRKVQLTTDEINRRFDEIIGEDNSDSLLDNMFTAEDTNKNTYNATDDDIRKLQMLLLHKSLMIPRLRRYAESGFTHLSQFSKQMELMQDEEERANKKYGRNIKIRALEKLVKNCCFEAKPCFIGNFSRIC